MCQNKYLFEIKQIESQMQYTPDFLILYTKNTMIINLTFTIYRIILFNKFIFYSPLKKSIKSKLLNNIFLNIQEIIVI